jgi:hypothetical protein
MLNTKFESERIVILGGTSGIGLASAEGYTVNVRHEEEIRDLFGRLGSFDHLAFTAGETLQIGAVANSDLDAARRALDVRLWGA